MSATRKPETIKLGAMPDGRPIEISFEEFLGELPVTPADRALGALGATGLPGLVAVAVDGAIPAALTAIDPKLTLHDLDKACDKLEDLAILLLSNVCAARNQIGDLIEESSSATLAAKSYGEVALVQLDFVSQSETLDADEIENSRRLLRSIIGGKSKKTAKG